MLETEAMMTMTMMETMMETMTMMKTMMTMAGQNPRPPLIVTREGAGVAHGIILHQTSIRNHTCRPSDLSWTIGHSS